MLYCTPNRNPFHTFPVQGGGIQLFDTQRIRAVRCINLPSDTFQWYIGRLPLYSNPLPINSTNNMKKEELNIYVSPQAKTVEIKAQAIICTSTERLTTSYFDWDEEE